MALMWSGVVPQEPPTRFTSPSRANWPGKEVAPTRADAADLLAIRLSDPVERDGPQRGVVDPGRERQRLVERPDRPGDEAAPQLGRGLSRQPRTLDVQLADDRLEPVVGLT